MKLIVFKEDSVAYLVPNRYIPFVKTLDKIYDKNDATDEEIKTALDFISMIKTNFKPIEIGHALTGDLQ